MKKYFTYILILIFLFFQLSKACLANISTNETIGTVNGGNLYLNEFNRLLNTQKRQMYKIYHFDLFALPTENPKATLKREEQIIKAKEKDLKISTEEFNKALEELITQYGNIESIEAKASENSLTLRDIKTKLEENLLLEKFLEESMKDKLVNLMVDELLILEEAKKRSLEVSEEEINKKINLIKEKHGGENGFQNFLSKNNAAIEDARNEIKNQILFDLARKELLKENIDLQTFLNKKRLNSTILIYNDKIQIEVPEVSIRNNPYSTITTTKSEKLNNIKESSLLQNEFKELREKIEQRQVVNKE